MKLVEEKQAEPVKREYQGRDGEWHSFIDEEHYQNTLADGSWPIRDLYTHPPAKQERLTEEELEHALGIRPHLGDGIVSAIESACAKKWGVKL